MTTLSAVSALAGKASAIGSVASLLFGSTGAVMLGSMTLSGIEVPEKIKWGGSQKIEAPELPGGIVNLFAMGIRYPPIEWHGTFDGFDALTRSKVMYNMMNDALVIPLSWNDRMYSVMIEHYHADDTQPNWIPYDIKVKVLRDETLFGYHAQPSLSSQILSDITGALGITPSDLSSVASALTTAQQVSQAVGAVTAGSSASLALSGSLASAKAAASASAATANGNLSAVAAASTAPIPPGTASSGIANLTTATTSAGDAAALSAISGQIGRAQANLGNAST